MKIIDYLSIIKPYKTNVDVNEINKFTTNLRNKFTVLDAFPLTDNKDKFFELWKLN